MARYYVEMDGYQYGPFDLEELRQLNVSGVLASTSHVREEHAPEGEVLAQLLANVPSPQPDEGGTIPAEQTPSGQPEPLPPVQGQTTAASPTEAGQVQIAAPEPEGQTPLSRTVETSAFAPPETRAAELPAATVSWSERLAQLRGGGSSPAAAPRPEPMSGLPADAVRPPVHSPEPARMQSTETTAPEEAASRPASELGRFVPEQLMPSFEPAAASRMEASAAPSIPTGQSMPAFVETESTVQAAPAAIWQETGSAPQPANEVLFQAEQGNVAAYDPKPVVPAVEPPAGNPAAAPVSPPTAGSWPPPAVFADLKLAPVGNDDAAEESSSFSLPPLKYGIEETDLKTPSEWLEPPPPRPRPSMVFDDPDQDAEIPGAASSAAQPPVSPVVARVAASSTPAPVGNVGGAAPIPEGAQPVSGVLPQAPGVSETAPADPIAQSVPITQSGAAVSPAPITQPTPAVSAGVVSTPPRKADEEELTLSKEKLSRLDDIYGRSRPTPIVAQPETGAMRNSMQQQTPETFSGAVQEEEEKPAAGKTNLIAGLVLIGAGAVSLLAGSEYLNLTSTCPGPVMALILLGYGVLALVGGLLTWLEVRWAAPIIRILALIPLGVLLACVYYHLNDLMNLKVPAYLRNPLMYNAISLLATVLGPAIWPGRSKTKHIA